MHESPRKKPASSERCSQDHFLLWSNTHFHRIASVCGGDCSGYHGKISLQTHLLWSLFSFFVSCCHRYTLVLQKFALARASIVGNARCVGALLPFACYIIQLCEVSVNSLDNILNTWRLLMLVCVRVRACLIDIDCFRTVTSKFLEWSAWTFFVLCAMLFWSHTITKVDSLTLTIWSGRLWN